MDLARRVQPPRTGTLILDSVCQNQDFANVRFRTARVLGSEGEKSWWAIRCRRDLSAWSCERATREKRLEISIDDEGRPVKLIGSFPDSMGAVRAKAIIKKAALLAISHDMPIPPCPNGSEAGEWSWITLPRSHSDAPIAEVNFTPGGVVIEFEDKLQFMLSDDDQPTCWDFVIVVT